jgi:hypothetical protein
MVLYNDDPSKEWIEQGRDHNCEIYVQGQVEFSRANLTLVPAGPEQKLVRYALRIDDED